MLASVAHRKMVRHYDLDIEGDGHKSWTLDRLRKTYSSRRSVTAAANEVAEKLSSLRKSNHQGWSPHTFLTIYAALKGRSSTGAHTFHPFFCSL